MRYVLCLLIVAVSYQPADAGLLARIFGRASARMQSARMQVGQMRSARMQSTRMQSFGATGSTCPDCGGTRYNSAGSSYGSSGGRYSAAAPEGFRAVREFTGYRTKLDCSGPKCKLVRVPVYGTRFMPIEAGFGTPLIEPVQPPIEPVQPPFVAPLNGSFKHRVPAVAVLGRERHALMAMLD